MEVRVEIGRVNVELLQFGLGFSFYDPFDSGERHRLGYLGCRC